MILTLDLGAKTGWCAGRGDVLPTVGTIYLPSTGDDCGAYGQVARRELHLIMARWSPDIVVFEAPVLPATTTLATTRKLQGLAFMVEVVCADLGVPCQEEFLQTIKKTMTGKGNASKQMMVDAARRMGLDPKVYWGQNRFKEREEQSDEADAAGIWLCGLEHHASRYLHHWQALALGHAAGTFDFNGAEHRDETKSRRRGAR